MIIESGDPWWTRENKHNVHLMMEAPNPQPLAVMPRGIVSSTVLRRLTQVAPQP
jgi:hypothetical protein